MSIDAFADVLRAFLWFSAIAAGVAILIGVYFAIIDNQLILGLGFLDWVVKKFEKMSGGEEAYQRRLADYWRRTLRTSRPSSSDTRDDRSPPPPAGP